MYAFERWFYLLLTYFTFTKYIDDLHIAVVFPVNLAIFQYITKQTLHTRVPLDIFVFKRRPILLV